jgi:hypothetical protein
LKSRRNDISSLNCPLLTSCSDLPADFRTIDKLRDWLPIRREQCGKDDFRKSKWWRSSGRRIAIRWRRWPSGTASASRRSTLGASASHTEPPNYPGLGGNRQHKKKAPTIEGQGHLLEAIKSRLGNLPPSPPTEKAAACEDQAGKPGTNIRYGHRSYRCKVQHQLLIAISTGAAKDLTKIFGGSNGTETTTDCIVEVSNG